MKTTSSALLALVDNKCDSNGQKKLLNYFDGGDFKSLTYSGFKRSINYSASLIKEKIDSPCISDDGITAVGYLAVSSPAYLIHLFGLMKLKFVPVLLSPRNSVSILVHLLRETNSKYLVYGNNFKKEAEECQKDLPNLILIEISNFLIEEAAKTGEDCALVESPIGGSAFNEDISAIFHSSGSTGLPKPIKYSNRAFHHFIRRDCGIILPEALKGNGFYLAPFFHAFGFLTFLLVLTRDGTLSLPSASASTVTPSSIIKEINLTKSTYAVLLPYLLIQTVAYGNEKPEIWNDLSLLDMILYGGACLAKDIINSYKSKGVKLVNCLGTTETGHIAYSSENPQILQLSLDVKYSLHNYVDGIGQLFIHKDDECLASGLLKSGEDGYIIQDLIEVKEYNKDENILKFFHHGRSDDLIVHNTGEKSIPIPIELKINTCPYVKNSFVFGNGYACNCVVIELNVEKCKTIPLSELTSIIIKQVEMANEEAPSHSRILPELVYILPLDGRTLPITIKGNIIRKKCEMEFKEIIEKLYQNFEKLEYSEIQNNIDEKPDIRQIEATLRLLFKISSKRIIDNDGDLIKSGLDSLTAVKFRNLINSKFHLNISVSKIYELTTISKITDYINDILLGKQLQEKKVEDYQMKIDQLISDYSDFSGITSKQKQPNTTGKLTVLLTGANGSLGNFIIKALLDQENIETIYCLIRSNSSQDSKNKLVESFDNRRIKLTELEWSKLKILCYNISAPRLDLTAGVYKTILNSVDMIYHIAWNMDFLKGIDSFQECIEGTINLLKICVDSRKNTKFNFVSSIGAALPVKGSEVIKEQPLSTQLRNYNSCNGYNLSKLISEETCKRWKEYFKFKLNIYRIGQISGDSINGIWNTREHIPILIKAAQVMKIIPMSFGKDLTWIPVDYCANSIVEISMSDQNQSYHHIINPISFDWNIVFEGMKSMGIEFEVVSNSKFLHTLKNISNYQDADSNPIVSLVDFIDGTLEDEDIRFDTSQTALLSKSIKNCAPLTVDLVQKYIRSWKEIGFINPTIV